jgi:signal transduction histidine kinase
VLINLLSNAVKYNRRDGEIVVGYGQPSAERIILTVADTGRGMTAGQLEKLFEPFDRLGAESSFIEAPASDSHSPKG